MTPRSRRGTPPLDCLIIGGGPAGLTAAIYAARFHLSVLLIDAGGGRAAQIPCTRNHAGFPDGISGLDLLARMRTQALKFGAHVLDGRVTSVSGTAGDFVVRAARAIHRARAVILCTGVSNHRPRMPATLHAQALAAGRIRYCPICDGYEVTDQSVAVIGRGARASKEAEFLRSYTDRVTLVSDAPDNGLSGADRDRLAGLGVTLAGGPVRMFELTSAGLALSIGADRHLFDAVYPALGSTAHSDLAAGLGAVLTDEGCIKVDAHQRTSVEGLYAAGDVVVGLDQISHAMGEGGVAVTTLRNDLAAQAPQLRA